MSEKSPYSYDSTIRIYNYLKKRNHWENLCFFSLGIETLLRSSDLVSLKVERLFDGQRLKTRLKTYQQKTAQPVHVHLSPKVHFAVSKWLENRPNQISPYVFPARYNGLHKPHRTTSHFRRQVKHWTEAIGLNPKPYSTHSLRKTKATRIYQETKDIALVSRLLGHSNTDATIRYLGINRDQTLEASEQYSPFSDAYCQDTTDTPAVSQNHEALINDMYQLCSRYGYDQPTIIFPSTFRAKAKNKGDSEI